MPYFEFPKRIAIEGIDGAGKATQAALLAENLKAYGVKTRVMSFPRYNTPTGAKIKEYLDGAYGNPVSVDPWLASTLYTLDRAAASHDNQSSISFVSEGEVLIFDRYQLSNLAHQGAKLPVPQRPAFREYQLNLEDSLGLARPDMTIILATSAHVSSSLSKQRSSQDGHESNLAYLTAVRDEYLEIARLEGFPVINCDAGGEMRSQEEIARDVICAVLVQLKPKK